MLARPLPPPCPARGGRVLLAPRSAALALAALGIALAARPARAQAPVAADSARPRAAVPDVRFMQQMIGHHAQAVAMSALVPARSSRADVRAVAERIAVAQGDELALMRRWLAERGAPVPGDSAGGANIDHAAMGHGGHPPGHGAEMPGMLTPAELARLGTLRGPAFDRAFLAGMVRHHQGALAMVAGLLAEPGAAQDAALFRLASDVDAGQRAEIRRLRAMLAAPAARR